MKILLCHNYYQEPGGEDRVFADEAALLESRGHAVTRYTLHNDAVSKMGRLVAARKTFWNRQAAREIRALIERERPDILHCTNVFPLISPAIYYAARRAGVPVVQSLHNYRLLCPSAVLLRDGRLCEACVNKAIAWPSVLHGCYRSSRAGSAVVAGMLGLHRLMKTWTRVVDRYIVLSQFAKRKFIAGGLPEQKIAVKPNFVAPDPGAGSGSGGYAVYVGRLSPEKGIETLLAAWSQMREPVTLKIVGDGPLAARVQAAAARDGRIEWLGRRSFDEVLAIVGEAAALVFPSTCYETFGRTIIEAFAGGTPVIASRRGAMAELVDDGTTGLLFEPESASDLAASIRRAFPDPRRLAAMRQSARDEFERQYTADANYEQLMDIYGQAIGVAAQPAAAVAC